MHAGKSGTFAFRSWRLWYGAIGDVTGGKVPLLCVCGGPGVPHGAMESMTRWLPPDRPMVFYDPSGAGRSDHPEGVDWDVELFIEEVATLREALGLTRVHLFGPSFGGLVSLLYALRRPAGLVSMALVGTTSSMPASREAILRQIEAMPPPLRDALLGQRGTVAYLKAYYQWVALHMCRVPLPRELTQAMSQCNLVAMKRIKGDDAIGFGGAAKDLDITDRLPEIDVPTLLTCGRHDSLYPEIIERMHRAMPRSRMVVFPSSAHMPQYEEPEAFMRTLFQFLDEHEPRP